MGLGPPRQGGRTPNRSGGAHPASEVFGENRLTGQISGSGPGGPGRAKNGPPEARKSARSAQKFGYLITLPVGTAKPKNFFKKLHFFSPDFWSGAARGGRKMHFFAPLKNESNFGPFFGPIFGGSGAKNRPPRPGERNFGDPDFRGLRTPFFLEHLLMGKIAIFRPQNRGAKKCKISPRGAGFSGSPGGPPAGGPKSAQNRDFRGFPCRRPNLAIFGSERPPRRPGLGRAFLAAGSSVLSHNRRRYAAVVLVRSARQFLSTAEIATLRSGLPMRAQPDRDLS